MTVRADLRRLQRERRGARLFREELDDERFDGDVLAVGRELVLLAGERDWVPWGYTALRVADVTRAQEDPWRDERERLRALQGRERPPTPDVDTGSLGALLLSASASFPLVTIHLEERDPDVCFVGRALRATPTTVRMRTLSPAARWYARPERFRLADVTRVDFGGPYESALALLEADDRRRAARRRKRP